MDATTAANGLTSLCLHRTWLNTDAAGKPYWPTVADYLNDLREHASKYHRKARRRQRLDFHEVWQLRRLLSCLPELQDHRERLSSADQTAFDEASDRLKDAFRELAKAEHLNPELLLPHVRKRLSPEWTRWLRVHIGSLQQQLYVAILEDAHEFTRKARSKRPLTEKEKAGLTMAANRIGYFELESSREKDETPILWETCEYAHERIHRVAKVMNLRFRFSLPRTADEFFRRIETDGTKPEDALEQEISELLQTVPETWGDYDADTLTDVQSKALFELVAAGMVERRTSFRLTLFGHPVAVEATITLTGEYGGVEALERVAAGVWDEWRDAYEKRQAGELKGAPAFHCERIGREQWRLTDQGILARREIEAGKPSVVFDFVLKRGFFSGEPRLMPDGRITRREPIRGTGTLDKMKLVKAAAEPAGVSIANWEAGGTAFAQAFAAAFAAMQQKAAAPAVTAAPATEDKGTASESPRGYTVSEVLEMTGGSNTTLSRYAKAAGVKTPGRGQRNYRFSANDVRKILRRIIETSSTSDLRTRCQEALENLQEIKE